MRGVLICLPAYGGGCAAKRKQNKEVTALNRYIIRVTSVTYAMRAQKLLERQGIRAYVRKMAKNLSQHGCGYGVEVVGDPAAAADIISASGIRVVEITQA